MLTDQPLLAERQVKAKQEIQQLDQLVSRDIAKKTQCEEELFNTDNIVLGTFKRWSPAAVACYVRDAKCQGCYYQTFFSDRPYDCKMFLAVEQLLQTHGKPSKSLMNRFGG